ncbi:MULTISPECIES: septation protein IspZ [unclassified Acinetobacter]|uniref:septation protein IspZ n=1 Tax=unclassified Acinetobacter TaxID=196816 RepID=UPI00293488E0|nr:MULTISPECIES: septation protein IspZ [unclassified Acinetobacter]WOE31250.1 septation protein IspZ [Acinetobacter sp. SAAs470]WOE39446.1 septation protein IspZ [Acinetobacter sp. SAAs474]
MKKLLKGLVIIGFMLYPFLVAYGLSQGQYQWVSMLLIALGIIKLLDKKSSLLWPLATFAILCGGLNLCLKDQAWLKLYPVLMSLGALVIFAMTLFKPPSMIERFARLVEPDLPVEGVLWTKKVTIVWCIFFLLNAVISGFTVFFTSTYIWTIYNGLLSYLLMGMILMGEFILRKRQQYKYRINK